MTNEKLAAGINAAKLADGSVTNAALQFIGSLTSDAQAQINALNTAGTSTSTAISTNTTNIATNTSGINDLKTLANGKIYIGNASNEAAEEFLSGDMTITNSGLATIAVNAITTNKILDAAVTNEKLAPGIDAAKLADGSVTDTKIVTVSGSKVTGIVAGANGGTGVANSGRTITLGGNINTAGDLTTSGAFATTLTSTATTSVTLPTSGTLSTLDGTETLTNKTLTSPILDKPRANLLIGNSTLPAATPGINVTSVTITGTNLAGTIEIIKPNNNGSAGEVLVTVTYLGTSFGSGGDSYPILFPANSAAAALSGSQQVFTEGTGSNFTINIGGGLFNGIYKWNYQVIGK